PTTDEDAVRRAEESLSRGEPVTLETGAVRKDGTPISLEVRLTPMENPTRSTALVLGVHHEISSRRAEDARFRALIRNAGDIISIVDADGTVLYVSPSVEAVLGRRPDDMVGMSFLSYL